MWHKSLVTVGDRSFAAAGPRLWKSLPADVQSAQWRIQDFCEGDAAGSGPHFFVARIFRGWVRQGMADDGGAEGPNEAR